MILGERLFIYNVLECCGYKEYKEDNFFGDLDDVTVAKIKMEIDIARNAVSKLPLDKSARSVLPRKFIKFIEENKEPRARSKNYFLYQLYDQIVCANHALERQKSKNGCEDKIIDDFLDIVENNDCLHVFSRPKDILQMSSKAYVKKQKEVITFLLREIIPQYEVNGETFSDGLLSRYKTWEQLILYRGRDQVPTIAIQREEAAIAEEFEKYYNELKADRCVGNTLEEIFDRLVHYSKRDCFVEAEKHKSTSQNGNNNRASVETDGIKATDYDATIGSGILGFMRWLPMVEDNWEPQLMHMEAIERVIEKIRNDYIELAKLEQEDSEREGPVDENYIFGAVNAIALRKKLILAMNDEMTIRELFCNYYCQAGGTKDE